MQIVPIAETEIRKRQRTAMPPAELHKLKEKISAQGVLHPPVYWRDEKSKTWILNAGERRTRAIQALHAEGREVRCNDQTIPPGHLPITLLDARLDEIGRFETELDENELREPLSWQDRARAYSDLHKMRLSSNPGQSFVDTGKEVAERSLSGKPTTPGSARVMVQQAAVIAEHLHDDTIANARNANEAYGLILKKEEEAMKAVLASRGLAKITAAPQATIKLRHGDCLTILESLDSDMADLILVDPPYGLDADAGGFRQRTVHHHNYEDTPEQARLIAKAVIVEGFRVCKTRANLFMFCDIDLFPWLKATAQNMGWTPFRRPLIWQKSQSEGLAPWGSSGPRITTEFILYATKGQRGLNASPIDVFDDRRVLRSERVHAAEKPIDLLKKLIQCSTLPGDFVFDPCMGSGSTLLAAKELRRFGLGIEKDEGYYNTAMANVFGSDLAKSNT